MPVFGAMFRRGRPGSIEFLTDTPALPNLGDTLCSPRHYFAFSSEASVVIAGGGAFNDLAVKKASKLPADIRIAWAIGQSWRFGTAPQPFDLGAVRRTYARATTRDPLAACDAIPLLPCVSVLHPIVDSAPGAACGLFLNLAEAASGARTHASLAAAAERQPGLVTGTNALDAAAFMALFARTGTVTTNSYHVAYWSLLSGREVRLIGYSSKFINLLRLFGLNPEALVRYDRGDAGQLADAIVAAEGARPLSLPRPAAVRDAFRDANRAFAAALPGITATPINAAS